MADLDLNELVPEDLRAAFAAMWPREKDAAAIEVRRLLEWVSKPAEHLTDTQNLVRRIFLGLVGEVPDLNTWLQAVVAGSIRLRDDQRYVVMRSDEKPARFLRRGLKTYDEGPSARQRWAGITDAGVKEGMHLVAFLIIAKELKNLASGPAALGPAWPLMVAIDSYMTNEEQRALHSAGSNEELQRALADAIKAAVRPFVTARRGKSGGRAADWRRELPPGTNAVAYFEAKGATVATPLPAVPSQDPLRVEELILRGPRPSFLPADVEPTDRALPLHLDLLLPGERADDEVTVFGKAIRAIARKKAREEMIRSGTTDHHSDDFKIQIWLRDWARRGGGIPENLPPRFLSYLEEEACLAFETLGNSWTGARVWRQYRVIGDEPSKAKPEELPWDFWDDGSEMTWINPPRRIDRIDVTAMKMARAEGGSIFD